MENQATFVRFTPEGALEASRVVQGHPLAAAMLRDYARLLLEDEARRSPVMRVERRGDPLLAPYTGDPPPPAPYTGDPLQAPTSDGSGTTKTFRTARDIYDKVAREAKERLSGGTLSSPVPPAPLYPPGWVVPCYGDGGAQVQHPQPTQASGANP